MSDTMDKKVNLKDLKKVFWRSFLIECSYNSERMHNLGYIYSLTPVLKKVYKDDREGMSGALQRHVEFYNATPQIEPCIIGIVSALEEQNAQSGNQMGTIVSAVKAGLMGPMSVIGDTLFFTSGFRIIAVSVGAAMCAAGNPLGLLLYFLIFNIPHYIVRYWGVTRGYKLGSNFIDMVIESGLLKKVTDVAQENLQKLFHIMSVFCVCFEFRGLLFADRIHGFDPQCPINIIQLNTGRQIINNLSMQT